MYMFRNENIYSNNATTPLILMTDCSQSGMIFIFFFFFFLLEVRWSSDGIVYTPAAGQDSKRKAVSSIQTCSGAHLYHLILPLLTQRAHSHAPTSTVSLANVNMARLHAGERQVSLINICRISHTKQRT